MGNPVSLSVYQLSSTELAGIAIEAPSGPLTGALRNRHGNRVGRYVQLLGLELGLSAEEAAGLGWAAALHDVGKIGLPDSVLRKPAPLDAEEWEIVKKHPLIGAALLNGPPMSPLNLARQIALTHHEHWDGSGYPNGLEGESIPLAGRITIIVDRYDALRSRRPYKGPFGHKRTCEVLLRGDGRSKPEHFDPRVLEAFRKSQDRFSAIHRSAAG